MARMMSSPCRVTSFLTDVAMKVSECACVRREFLVDLSSVCTSLLAEKGDGSNGWPRNQWRESERLRGFLGTPCLKEGRGLKHSLEVSDNDHSITFLLQ